MLKYVHNCDYISINQILNLMFLGLLTLTINKLTGRQTRKGRSEGQVKVGARNIINIIMNFLFCLLLAPPSTGLYFMLDNNIYLPGDSVLITDIGTQPGTRVDPGSTLICVTSNVNTACCRGADGGNVGEWFYPDGSMVPRPGAISTSTGIFARYGHNHQVRLGIVGSPTGPLGAYRCDVPDGMTGTIVSASINIIAPPPGM